MCLTPRQAKTITGLRGQSLIVFVEKRIDGVQFRRRCAKGSRYLGAVDFFDDPALITGRQPPQTDDTADSLELFIGTGTKHWFVDSNSWVNADSDSPENYFVDRIAGLPNR